MLTFSTDVWNSQYVVWSAIAVGTITWSSGFGSSGFSTTNDMLALENSAGQVLDRVTYGNYGSYYSESSSNTITATSTAPASVGSNRSINRSPAGTDSDNDRLDWYNLSFSSGGNSQEPTVTMAAQQE